MYSDFTGRILLISLALGTATCDLAWALIVLSSILYFGFPLILRSQHSPAGGLMRQRGVALFLIIILSTLFMRADKAHYEIRQVGILSEQDQLIRSLSDEAENTRKAAEESNGSTAVPHLASSQPVARPYHDRLPLRHSSLAACSQRSTSPTQHDAQHYPFAFRSTTIQLTFCSPAILPGSAETLPKQFHCYPKGCFCISRAPM